MNLNEQVNFLISLAENYIKNNEDYITNLMKSRSNHQSVDNTDTDFPETRPEWKRSQGVEAYPRKLNRVENVIKKANYLCENNREHEYFLSKSTGKNYVEGHHLIPLEY